MSEGEVVEQLVEYTTILLGGVSVFFTIVSAYVAALNYFIATASILARLFAFSFVSIVLAMLMGILFGARETHNGLTARLQELQEQGDISAAGRAVLANAREQVIVFDTLHLTVDEAILTGVVGSIGLVYLGLIFLTFFHRWRPDGVVADPLARLP